MCLVPGNHQRGPVARSGPGRCNAAGVLLAIPALVAAGAYEAIKEASIISTAVGCLPTVLATGVSFVVGYASIAWLLRFVAKHSITVFIWYRVALAAVIAVLLGTGMLSPTWTRSSTRPTRARVA